jgi:hypothetical protein
MLLDSADGGLKSGFIIPTDIHPGNVLIQHNVFVHEIEFLPGM